VVTDMPAWREVHTLITRALGEPVSDARPLIGQALTPAGHEPGDCLNKLGGGLADDRCGPPRSFS
jgi:hypothetical protein